MGKLKNAAAVAVVTAGMTTGLAAAGGPAMAASTPLGACGADGTTYHVIDQHDLGKATMYLMYNGAQNCVVTWKDSPDSKYVEAYITRYESGDIAHVDDGYYSTYAGPVRTTAPGQCIVWAGMYDQTLWNSGKSHCG